MSVYSWEFADAGERLVFDCLQSDGWQLLNVADSGAEAASMLTGPAELKRAPDILGWMDGEPEWFEVKSKTDAIEFRKESQWRHGIDENSYEDYLAVQRRTGQTVNLIIYEKRRQTLLAARLDELPVVDRTTETQAFEDYGESVVFFPRSAFSRQADATRFNGTSYVEDCPVEELNRPVFADCENIRAWSTHSGGETA